MVIMMMLVMAVDSVAAVVRPPIIVVSAVIRIPTVIAVWVIPRVAVIAVPIGGITEPDSNSSDAD